MLPKSFALSDDDEESDCSIPRDDCEVPAISAGVDNPITINEYSSTAVELPNLCWHGYANYPKTLTLTNTGESVQITGKWGRGRPYVTGGPLSGSYLFSQIHFHWPSEHTLNEKRYPLEMHAVHYKAAYLTQERAMKESDGTIVLVYLFEVGPEPTTSICKMTTLLPKIKTKNCKTEICDSSLEDFMKPFLSNYFIYWGSAKIGQASYSLQWIISCTRQVISHKEFCDLKGLFHGQERESAKKPMRDAEPESKGIFLVGETVNRTCSETRQSEVRFSDLEKSYVTPEKSKSCCFLAKYRRRGSNSSPKKEYSCNKSVEEIYSRRSSSRCSQESSPCYRSINKLLKSCTDKNCQTLVCDPRNMNTQTSLRSVCTCSCSSKSKQSSTSESKSKCSDSYISEDTCGSSAVSSRDETCQKRKSKAMRCFLKNNETHDCIDNGCENQLCSPDCDSNVCESKRGNKTKKGKKDGGKRKRRNSPNEDTSSEEDTSEKAKCTLSCEVLETVKDGKDSDKLLRCTLECPEEDEEDSKSKKKKKKKKKDKLEKVEEKNQSEVTIEEISEEKKAKTKKSSDKTSKSKTKTKGVEVEDAQVEAKVDDVPDDADEVNKTKEPETTKAEKAVEGVTSEETPKEMGQHKPIILAPARINENMYILKSVGTMTALPPYSGHTEEIALGREGGEPLLNNASISNSQIWKKYESPPKELETLDKMLGIPESKETKDLELVHRQKLGETELPAPEGQLPAKRVLTEDANEVTADQSLATLLAKISKDPSLANVLTNVSSQATHPYGPEKAGEESSIGSILAKMSKDPSLACILAKISRDPYSFKVSAEPSGAKIAAEPSFVKIEEKPSTEKISREPSVSAIWAKLKKASSAGSDVDKSSKEPSLSSVLTELNRERSASNDLNKASKEPTPTADTGKTSKEQTLTIILASVSRNRKLASESVSKHSSLTSVLSKNSKEPTVSTDFGRTSKHQSADAFGTCRDVAVQEVVRSRPTKEEPNILIVPSRQETVSGSTKEQSLVSVLIRVSKEPSLARDLANILKHEPLPEEMTRSKEQSFACVLVRISKEPSLASDLANILKKEPIAESIRIETVSTHSTGVARPTKEESLANILVTVSKEPLLAADLAKCSKHQSFASILTKVSKASSLVVDVANVLDHTPSGSGMEGSISSILESKSKKIPELENPSENLHEGSVVSILNRSFKDPPLVSDAGNVSAQESYKSEQEKTTTEQSLASVRVEASKEASLATDPANVLKIEPETGEEIRKAKKQSLCNILAKVSADRALAADFVNILKHESLTSHSFRPTEEGRHGNISRGGSRVPSLGKDSAKHSRQQSVASVFSRISNKPLPVSDVGDVLEQEPLPKEFAKPAEEEPKTSSLAAEDTPMVTEWENSQRDALRVGDVAEPPKKDSWVSRKSAFVNEVVKSIVEASLGEIQPSANKKSSLASEISRHSKNQSLANILNKVSREPSLANDLAKSFAKESLVEIFLAVARQPSLASDISRFSKNQSLVKILNRVSREPSLAKDLAESVIDDTLTEILCAVTKQPLLVSEISKYSNNPSVVNILNRISREPFLADDIAKSIAEDIMIEILLAVTKDPSLASNISKHSRNQSLNNVLEMVSREPSLAVDLAKSLAQDSLTEILLTVAKQPSVVSSISKYSKHQSLVNVLDRISRELSSTTDSARILKEEFFDLDPERCEKEVPWSSNPCRNVKASSMSSMKSTTPDSSKLKHQSIASVLDQVSREPSGSATSAKSVAEQLLAHILASVVKEPSSNDDLGALRPKSLADILLIASREPSLASGLAVIAEQLAKEPSPSFHSAKELASVDVLARHSQLTANGSSKSVKDSSANVLTEAPEEAPFPPTSPDHQERDMTTDLAQTLSDDNTLRDNQTTGDLAPGSTDRSLANISAAMSKEPTAPMDPLNTLKKSPIPSLRSEISKDQGSVECSTRSVKDSSSSMNLARSSPKTIQAFDIRPPGVVSTNSLENSIPASRAEDLVTPEERVAILKASRSYTVSKEELARRFQMRESEKIADNLDVKPARLSPVDTERPEVEKLHRQEDLNESIQSRRSTETRSVDYEMAVDSCKKKTVPCPQGSQLDTKTESDGIDVQPFEEYYVRVENDSSVLQEYEGKLDETEIVPGNSMKLRLLPKTSVPMNDLNLEMEDCIIRFDSKEKTEELYVEAHFLVGKKPSSPGESRNSDQSIKPSSLRALEVTNDVEGGGSENSLVRTKALYFISQAIEVDPKTGKKVLIGRFARDNNCEYPPHSDASIKTFLKHTQIY